MTTPLIDATEMYLRTVWELEEEGIIPIRARLVERLGLSAPAVSETVARLEHDGLVHVSDNRTLELSDTGRRLAMSVMRKHRLAELLLTDVIGLEWEQVHLEACRWEHVISDAVEQRLIELLDHPTTCPHGNPIPGAIDDPPATLAELQTMTAAARSGGRATLCRISEQLQSDVTAMKFLRTNGLRPGVIAGLRINDGGVLADVGGGASVAVPGTTADHIYVSPAA